MKVLKYLLFIIPSILAITFFVLFIDVNGKLDQARNEFKKKTEKYNNEKDELISKNKKLKRIESSIKNISENSIYLYSNDIKDMKEKGLSNPVQDIISNLMKHNELIPYKGVLGGTMRFYEKEIIILTNKWVLAYFEDGHIGGYLLLEYDISNDGKINWKRIASHQ
jgi:ABC-type microcin C transport system permease subunit YejB